jgi:hypothetical protein
MWIQIDQQEFERGGADYIRSRIEHYQDIEDDPLTSKYRNTVELRDLEVDEDAVVSVAEDDSGAYVMCWQWVSNEQAGIDDEEDGDDAHDAAVEDELLAKEAE